MPTPRQRPFKSLTISCSFFKSLVEDGHRVLVLLEGDVEECFVPPHVLRQAHSGLPVRGSLLHKFETLIGPFVTQKHI